MGELRIALCAQQGVSHRLQGPSIALDVPLVRAPTMPWVLQLAQTAAVELMRGSLGLRIARRALRGASPLLWLVLPQETSCAPLARPALIRIRLASHPACLARAR